jgi:hypothetical protein
MTVDFRTTGSVGLYCSAYGQRSASDIIPRASERSGERESLPVQVDLSLIKRKKSFYTSRFADLVLLCS